MSVSLLSTTIASSISADVSQLSTGGHTDAGNFMALLNSAIANQFDALSLVSDNGSTTQPATFTLQNTQNNTQFASAPPPPAATQNTTPVHQDTVHQDTTQNAPPPAQQQQQAPVHMSQNNDNTSSGNTGKTQGNTGQTTQSSSQTTNSNTSQGTQTPDPLQSQKQLRTSLHQQLDAISQILSSVIQLLTASGATTTPASSTGTTPAVTTPVVTATGTNNTSQTLASQVAGAMMATVSTTNTPQPAQGNILQELQNIQSMLQQLQQQLQGADKTAGTTQAGTTQATITPVSTNTTSPSTVPADTTITASISPTSIPFADALNQALIQLSKLLPQKPATDTTATGTSTNTASTAIGTTTSTQDTPSSGTQTNVQASDIVSLIKANIANVRQQLQALNGQNEAIFSHIQNNAQSPGLNTQQLLGNALAGNGLTLQDHSSQLAVSYSSTITPAQSVPAVTPDVSTQGAALFAAGIVSTQQGGDSSTNTDSGAGGQNQAAAQPVAAAGINGAAPTSGTGGASFSKLLDQSSPQPLINQVAFQVKTAVSDGSSKITIQLHPEDLGRVDIKLNVDATGKTSVAVTTDNHHTLDLLQRDAQGLTKALNDAGLKTDSGSLSFNLSNGQQQQQQASSKGNSNNGQSITTYQNTQPDDEQESNLTILTRSYVVNVAQGLDIQI